MESTRNYSGRVGTSLALASITAALAACASTPPPPTAALDAAHLAIANAERADAGRYAPNDLAEARAKLESADVAVGDKRMDSAARLANESRTEAELALANTGATKARAVNGDMQRSNSVLEEEMQRKTGDKQ